MQPPQRGARDVSPQMHRGDRRQPGSRTITPVPSRGDTFTPPPPATLHSAVSAPPRAPGDAGYPTQLKVRVHCIGATTPSEPTKLSLVVPANISYQSLKDRIDAKLQRSTSFRLSEQAPKEAQVKLKFLDEDDYVSIQSDEDVMSAFETWREQQQGQGMAEVELFCQR